MLSGYLLGTGTAGTSWLHPEGSSMGYIDPKFATKEDIAAAEIDRPVHTCQDDFVAGHCPACNRLEWLEAARAALLRR